MAKKREGPVIFSKTEPYAGLKKALRVGRSEVLDQVRDSNIKGRGGAGFPTGVKWNLAATASDKKKYVICNADEGEPGTFKDRVLLDEYARLIFEGMVISAFAVGAQEGILYLRGEYISLVAKLEETLNQMRKNNFLGKDICKKKGFNFDVRIRLGVGAYVCGEETSLIESLEGQRGEPRSKPPFPTNTGFNGHPTVINNVETFAVIAHIILKGSNWFRSIGTDKSSGSKLVSVSGDCKNPGVYEIAFGTTIKKILKIAEAEDTKAVQVGGASGICVSKKDFNRKIAFEDLSTGGSIIVFNKKRNLLEVAENFLNFFSEESCGQCTPCREGISVLQEKLKKIKESRGSKEDIEDIFSLSETMELASKCGLGQTASAALISILTDFKKEYAIAKQSSNKEALLYGKKK